MFLLKSPLQKTLAAWKAILVFSIVFSLLTGLLTLFLYPLEYRADGQVYIISQSSYGVDPYTAIKSSERIGENLSRILYTEDFYNRVMMTESSNFDKTYFTQLEERERRELWEKTIESTVEYGTGILSLSVYHQDREQVKYLADAIIQTIEREGYQYVGGNITIRVVNQPIVSKFPVRPNIALNTAIIFIFSLFGASFVISMKK
ncbi:MAG: hypothetical protein V1848_02390 [Candidatus Magasanikbacteria bacterium]